MYSVEDVIRRAIESNHRSVIIIEEDWVENSVSILRKYDAVVDRRYTVLVSGKEERSDASWASEIIGYLKERENVNWGYVPFKGLDRIMGTTWDVLVADFRRDMRPNDMGRLIELIRGGGLIIFLAPPRRVWKEQISLFHRDMVVYPYSMEDIKPFFTRYLVESMEISPGIFFLSTQGLYGEVDTKSKTDRRRKTELPNNPKFSMDIYNMAITQDQVDVLRAFERISDGGYLILTADRGRGKSAALGLGLGGLSYILSEGIKAVVTAPEPENIRELINFFLKALYKLGTKYEFDKKKHIITFEGGEVKYLPPYKAWREGGDVLIVDEAAGIPVYILENILGRFKIEVFSSTLHGYEGAGRGFQVRFLPLVRKIEGTKVIEVKMEEPVRYAPGDPIERWLFDALLLDSDPAPFRDDEVMEFSRSRLRFRIIDLEDWIFNKKDRLKEYVGIYIYAHYRNRPNDIMILCDAPHHFAAAVQYRGKIVNSLHLSYEGDMSDADIESTLAGEPPSGHLVPTVIIRYYPIFKEFAYLKGMRVVRIATHPDLMGRGIGSYALNKITKYAKDEDMDWIGSSFGVTPELLSFWSRNGFFPIYLSPNRNPVSGEYSVIVIKPLSGVARSLLRKIRYSFKRALLDTLIDPHYSLDTNIAYQLLSLDPWSISVSPRMNKAQVRKLKSYILGGLTFGAAYDSIVPIIKNHFLRSLDKRVDIPRKYEYALIKRVLQGRSWNRVSISLGMDKVDLMNRFRELIGRMRLKYIEEDKV